MFGDLNIANGYLELRIKFPMKVLCTDPKRAQATQLEQNTMRFKMALILN